MRHHFLALAALAAVVPAQSWVKLTPTSPPSARRAGAMAFDSTQNRLLAYGGIVPGPATITSETWSWNGTVWTLLNPPGGAPPRWGHQMVRITSINRLLTFGGRSPTISGLANDTYQWTGTAWTLVPTPVSPTARFRYGMAYDSLRNRVVLFGGRTLAGDASDTWEFDGVTWLQVTTAHSPPPREDMVLAFDAPLNRTVLFGGYDSDTDTLLGDTWEYDGIDWQEITATDSPSPRFRAANVYDSVRKRIVVYGGYAANGLQTDTYEYNGSSWTEVNAGSGTLLSTEMYAGYDSTRRKFVTFGGVGNVFGNETWEYTGINSGVFGMFGEGCPTSAGTSEGSVQVLPRINSALAIDWNNIPAATVVVIAIHGFSNTQWSGLPLPVDLGLIGFTQCNLLVSAEFADPAVVTVPGTVSTSIAIPNDSTLINVPFYSQLLIPDTEAFNGAGGTSRGVRVIFGS